ncbi:alcohol dehydrogenase transcription factor myb/SANT-like domain-containing protein [Phthorimaea operculella]|nr:alcohol dehydrogenase transcription factor myb/SANT-like domain-containing protein [Phthorimaea operculella]
MTPKQKLFSLIGCFCWQIDIEGLEYLMLTTRCTNSSPVKEAKSIWKKLRDVFRQAVRNRKSTSGQEAIKTSKWRYEDQMSFLIPTINNRNRHTNITPRRVNNDDMNLDETMIPVEDYSDEEREEPSATTGSGNKENIPQRKSYISLLNFLEKDRIAKNK